MKFGQVGSCEYGREPELGRECGWVPYKVFYERVSSASMRAHLNVDSEKTEGLCFMFIWLKIKGIFLFLEQREKAPSFNVDVFLSLRMWS